MTNKIEISRELLERCARELSIGIGPAPKNRAEELRTLLAKADEGAMGEPSNQGDEQTLVAQHRAFISGELEDLIDQASDFQDKAYALGLARGRLQAARIGKDKELNATS